jgi:hypothetical protein
MFDRNLDKKITLGKRPTTSAVIHLLQALIDSGLRGGQ